MNNQPQAGQTPSWFAEPTAQPPESTSSLPRHHKKIIVIASISLLILAVTGAILWYTSSIRAARLAAFANFSDAYISFESELTYFDDITEPEDFNPETLVASWDAYSSALEALSSAPFYKENISLIQSIRALSVPYKIYATETIPSLSLYINNCYETVYDTTCRSYIENVANSDDSITNASAQSFLTFLNGLADRHADLTDADTDKVLAALEDMFAQSTTIVDTLRPDVAELGRKIGAPDLPTNEEE